MGRGQVKSSTTQLSSARRLSTCSRAPSARVQSYGTLWHAHARAPAGAFWQGPLPKTDAWRATEHASAGSVPVRPWPPTCRTAACPAAAASRAAARIGACSKGGASGQRVQAPPNRVLPGKNLLLGAPSRQNATGTDVLTHTLVVLSKPNRTAAVLVEPLLVDHRARQLRCSMRQMQRCSRGAQTPSATSRAGLTEARILSGRSGPRCMLKAAATTPSRRPCDPSR